MMYIVSFAFERQITRKIIGGIYTSIYVNLIPAIKEPETGEVPKLSWKISGMANMTVYENNATSVKLQCVLEQGNPKPEFSWYKDNIPLHPNASGSASCKFARDGWYFTENGKQEMVICGNPLKFETFSGRYTCQARNKVGMDEIHADLQILGKDTLSSILFALLDSLVVGFLVLKPFYY